MVAYFDPSWLLLFPGQLFLCQGQRSGAARESQITKDAMAHWGWCQDNHTVTLQLAPSWSVRNQWSTWCPGDSREWWSFLCCPQSRAVIIWCRVAEPLITLQGQERVCECSEVTQQRHHLTLCEGMTIDSVACWNLVHKQRIMVVYNFCIWASGGLHLECGWKFSFIHNGSKQLKKSQEYSSFTFIKSYSIKQQKNKVV